MFRTKVDKTKQFLQDHTTAIACTVTGLVAWKLSHEVTLKGVLDETTKMAYEWGNVNGMLNIQNQALLDFVHGTGKTTEFLEFVGEQIRSGKLIVEE